MRVRMASSEAAFLAKLSLRVSLGELVPGDGLGWVFVNSFVLNVNGVSRIKYKHRNELCSIELGVLRKFNTYTLISRTRKKIYDNQFTKTGLIDSKNSSGSGRSAPVKLSCGPDIKWKYRFRRLIRILKRCRY